MPDPSAVRPLLLPEDDHLAALTAIVKRRYETGDYGHAHFRMTSQLWEAARRALPKPEASRPAWAKPALDALLAIPIVLDDDMGGDEWRLVDVYTEEILFRGGSTDV